MPGRRLSRWYSILPLLAVLALPATVTAQEAPACEGCIPEYAVAVTPDNGSETARTSHTAGYSATFTVRNTGLSADTYDLSCTVTGGSCTVSPSSVSLGSGFQTNVTANYATGQPQTGTITVIASSTANEAGDAGTRSVTITGGGIPTLSHTATEVRYRDMGKCVADCLHGTYARSTVSYFSMGQAQNATLVYNSGTHKPVVLVGVDATANAQTSTPTRYKVQVRKPNGTLATLLNGSTWAYFTAAGAPSSVPTRLTAALDAQANSLTTGAWPLTVIVTAMYPAGPHVDSLTQIAVVNDRSGSVLGAGMSLAGYQQIHFTNGRAAIAEGDGSIADYGASPYSAPPGATSVLTYNAGDSTYKRTYRDGSYVQFKSNGRMTKRVERFGATTTYGYFAAPNDTLLSVITDPQGKSIYPCYRSTAVCGTSGDGKLFMIRLLSGVGVERIHYYLMDGSARLIRVQDPDGQSDSLAYDATTGLLNRFYDRARNPTDLTYDGLRRVATSQRPQITLFDGSSGRPTTTSSSGDLKLWQPGIAGTDTLAPKTGLKGDTVSTSIQNPLGVAVRFTTDKFGGPTKIVDPFNAVTTISRDAMGRPVTITEPNGHYVTYTYNGYHQLSSTTDGPSGRTISYHYVGTGTDDISYISGNVVRADYHYYTGGDGGPAGALKKVYVGNTDAIAYPGIDSARLVSHHFPDGLGRDTLVKDSLGHGPRYAFDATWGNFWKATDPSGVTTRLTFDAVGRTDSTIVPLMSGSRTTYGSMNQVLSVTATGYRVNYSYDPASLALLRVETPRPTGAPGPVVFKYVYNAVGALVRRHDTADTTRADTLKYDIGGNLRRMVNRKGQAIDLTYDKVGRLLSRAGPGFPTDNYVYDTVAGRWNVAYNSVARDSFQLDTRGRLSVWEQVLNGRTYRGTLTYDAIDRVTRRVLMPLSSMADSSVVKYAYGNGVGTRDSLCAFASPPRCVTFKMTPDFAADTLVFNRGTASAWRLIQGYDASHRITAQTFAGGSNLGALELPLITYDSIGRNRTRTSPKGGSFTRRLFQYDGLGRLTNACDSTGSQCQNVVDGTTTAAWSYDSTGNRNQIGVTESYGAGNRLTAFGTTNFHYDSIGSIVCRIVGSCPGGTGSGYKYSWDALGRLRGIRNGSTGALVDSMFYDALGRRVRKQMASSDEYYVYEGGQVVLDVNAAGTAIREYVWYPGATDHLLGMRSTTPVVDTLAAIIDPINGTVRGMARFRNGTKVKEYAELPWGDTVADTGIVVRYRFAGREYDQESGLYYMRARYFDPNLGRWVSEDPIGLAGGHNIYAYSGNDPVNWSDPSGLDPCPTVPLPPESGPGGPLVAVMDDDCLLPTPSTDPPRADGGPPGMPVPGDRGQDGGSPSGGDTGPGSKNGMWHGSGGRLGRADPRPKKQCRAFGFVPIPSSFLPAEYTYFLGAGRDMYSGGGTEIAGGVFVGPSGVGLYSRGGVGIGYDQSVATEFGRSRNFFGLSIGGQLGYLEGALGYATGGTVTGTIGVSQSPVSFHVSATATNAHFRLISCR